MRDKRKLRFDWTPSPLALEAIEKAKARDRENLNTQALIDKLVILGIWAWEFDESRPPPLRGNRAYWR